MKDLLDHPLEVFVIGKNDIDKADLVISLEEPIQTEPVKKVSSREKVAKGKSKGQGLTVVLLHIDIKDTDENGLKVFYF